MVELHYSARSVRYRRRRKIKIEVYVGRKIRAKGNIDGSPGCPVSISVPPISHRVYGRGVTYSSAPLVYHPCALYLPTATHHHSHYPLTVTELSWDRTLYYERPFHPISEGPRKFSVSTAPRRMYLSNLSNARDVVTSSDINNT